MNGSGDVEPLIIQPEKLSATLTSTRGFIFCSGHCCPKVYGEANHFEPDKITIVALHGKTILVVRGPTVARCMALNGTSCEYEILLRNGECFQCCFRAALASPRARVLIVSK